MCLDSLALLVYKPAQLIMRRCTTKAEKAAAKAAMEAEAEVPDADGEF